MYKIFIQLKFKEEVRKHKNIQPIIEREDEKSQVMVSDSIRFWSQQELFFTGCFEIFFKTLLIY